MDDRYEFYWRVLNLVNEFSRAPSAVRRQRELTDSITRLASTTGAEWKLKEFGNFMYYVLSIRTTSGFIEYFTARAVAKSGRERDFGVCYDEFGFA